MRKLGLILNMVGVIILGFTPMVAGFGGDIKPIKTSWYIIGWIFLFIGFLLNLISECRAK